ncbi:MAG: hypothetical protein EOO15_15520 [Chitinophagaceae bacterium]|nr:MAG: hypothetical protein EOO15_15520 [Chitinophagaceae bacterium]
MTKLLSPLLASFILFACTTTENAKKIAGSWRGAAWTSNGQPIGQDPAVIAFTFGADGNYTYVNAGITERGLYQVQDNDVYTKPEGGEEIKVHIASITKDTLVFEMNRSGAPELLTLVRK